MTIGDRQLIERLERADQRGQGAHLDRDEVGQLLELIHELEAAEAVVAWLEGDE